MMDSIAFKTLLAVAIALLALAPTGCKEPDLSRSTDEQTTSPAPDGHSSTPGQAQPRPNADVVQVGDSVAVHYVGKLADGSTFDASRPRGEPLRFTVGAGQMIKGFDAGVVGMRLGEMRRLELKPEDGYGPHTDQAVVTVPRAKLPDLPPDIKVGDKLTMQTLQGPMSVTVTQIDRTQVTLDANHPLAGKTLFFGVELVELTKAR